MKSLLVVYIRLYTACVAHALTAVRKSPWTLLLPIALWAALLVAERLLAGFGFLAGLALWLAMAALVSSYLYFVSELTAHARVSVQELKRSMGAYFWAVVNLMFILWLVELLLGLALARSPGGQGIFLFWRLAAFVLLNATPEVIYRRGTHGGIATIAKSVQFIQTNWIEWFIPNVAFGAVFYLGVPALTARGVPLLAVAALAGALLHLVMVFRGALFIELDSSSHRQRMFKYRTGG